MTLHLRSYRLVLTVLVLAAAGLSFGCTATTESHFVLTQDIAQSHPDCEGIDPVPKQTATMAVLGEDARASARKYGAENVLILFDVDNTLLASRQLLGSDQWFTWREDVMEEGGFPCLLDAARLLFEHGSMRTTDPNAPSLVRALQAEGIGTGVLTSRGPDLQAVTWRELAVAGFDFLSNSPPGWFADDSKESQPARYEYGIFMTSGLNKGTMAVDLLNKTGIRDTVKKVIFVDDKAKHVCRVQKSMQELGIDVSAYHYTAEDIRVAPVVNRDPATMERLRKAWTHFEDQLVCRSEHCEEATQSCAATWKTYGEDG